MAGSSIHNTTADVINRDLNLIQTVGQLDHDPENREQSTFCRNS